MGEVITIFCTVLGTIIAYQTFKGSAVDDLKEARQILLEKFDLLKKLNADLISDLSSYGEHNNAYDVLFIQGLTLRQCLAILVQVQVEILADENFEVLKQTKSKMRIADIKASIETQIKHHSEIKTYYTYFINQR